MSVWNRRKDEDYAARPANQPATPVEPVIREGSAPTMSTSPRTYEPEMSRPPAATAAAIGKSVMIKGQIVSREDLYLDGEVEGTIELQEHKLTVGPHGRIQAAIKAREIVVLGAIQGNVDAAEKIEIRKDARLVGDIKTARIVIEDGAYFKGSIDITKTETAKPEKRPQPQPQPAPVQAAPAAVTAAAAPADNRR